MPRGPGLDRKIGDGVPGRLSWRLPRRHRADPQRRFLAHRPAAFDRPWRGIPRAASPRAAEAACWPAVSPPSAVCPARNSPAKRAGQKKPGKKNLAKKNLAKKTGLCLHSPAMRMTASHTSLWDTQGDCQKKSDRQRSQRRRTVKSGSAWAPNALRKRMLMPQAAGHRSGDRRDQGYGLFTRPYCTAAFAVPSSFRPDRCALSPQLRLRISLICRLYRQPAKPLIVNELQ